jgi:c-di-GMP-binding flagellar brake protein YcgR
MREKRRYVRANGLVLVNYKIPDLEIEGKSSAYDVSGGGLRITVNQKLDLATSIEMEIYLPGSSQPILAKGEVVWIKQVQEKLDTPLAEEKKYFYIGIKFNAIDENSKNRIINYVFRKYH